MLFVWIYAVVGTSYWLMYAGGSEVVLKYAVGPFWLMMVIAPMVLAVLILLPVARRLGLFDK